MGKPDLFKVKWTGCDCPEDKKGAKFDSEYNRFCDECNSKLSGEWLCSICEIETEYVAFRTSQETIIEVECCPKCGNILH